MERWDHSIQVKYQEGQLKREVLKEQFFTPVELARRCVDAVGMYRKLDTFDLIVEPSAGSGVFLNLLPSQLAIGLDIDPQDEKILEQDFLTWRPDFPFERILTIGNPPFGARASLAFKFINHAASFSDVIAFVLPMSFNKYTFQDRFPRNFSLVQSFDCVEAFETGHSFAEIKTVFQIWEKTNSIRSIERKPTKHQDFQMKHAHLSRVSSEDLEYLRSNFDFAIAQVGSNFLPKDSLSVTKGSYWFIKPRSPEVRSVFDVLDFSFLDRMNLAHKSLSRSDIIEAYEKAKNFAENEHHEDKEELLLF